MYIYSPPLHQNVYQKLVNCFSNFIPINIIPNNLNEEDVDIIIEETINNKDLEKSATEIETYKSFEELNFPQEWDDGGITFLDDFIEKVMNDPRVQTMFKRSGHKSVSIFIISQDYYELPERTIRANGNVYHIFEPNNYRDVQTHYQDKASMGMALNQFEYLASTCWDKETSTSHQWYY